MEIVGLRTFLRSQCTLLVLHFHERSEMSPSDIELHFPSPNTNNAAEIRLQGR